MKKCLTKRELLEWLNKAHLSDHVVGDKKNYTLKSYTRYKETFFRIEFNEYPEYVVDIGLLHEMFGRDIDVRTYWGENHQTQLCDVRAYSDLK